jgi:cysteinyl-tRNA synthetase
MLSSFSKGRIRLYNTLKKRVEDFIPLEEGRVGMYVCGVTVYDDFHLGHARSAVAFDIIRRWLEKKGYEVVMVYNFTDVDDKMIRRSKEEGITISELAERYIASYFDSISALNVKPASFYPRATEHINEMISLIERLEGRGLAYRTRTGVYYRVSGFPGYGKLSGRSKEEMMAGARVEPDEEKEDPLDFALWKAAKEGEPSWDSPWGPGRPGWHIECSAMAMKYLGETFDIHGGGNDLIFPHHENEIAQSEGATGKPFARYWVHNGQLLLGREKMSKSLGNFLTIKELSRDFDPGAIRYFLLTAHYRSPMEFREDGIREAGKGLSRLLDSLRIARRLVGELPDRIAETEDGICGDLLGCAKGFEEAMDEDFNTALAISYLHKMASLMNAAMGSRGYSVDGELSRMLKVSLPLYMEMMDALGLKVEEGRAAERGLVDALVSLLVEIRSRARKSKDFELADMIRGRLVELGVEIRDYPDGTVWRWEGKRS